tara:strand:+ start:686 stop:829 length:144 start_codon:yes stop_codon:yes gene_type:complete
MEEEVRKANMKKLNDKRKERILKATGNGRCWWLYQMLTHNHHNKVRR